MHTMPEPLSIQEPWNRISPSSEFLMRDKSCKTARCVDENSHMQESRDNQTYQDRRARHMLFINLHLLQTFAKIHPLGSKPWMNPIGTKCKTFQNIIAQPGQPMRKFVRGLYDAFEVLPKLWCNETQGAYNEKVSRCLAPQCEANWNWPLEAKVIERASFNSINFFHKIGSSKKMTGCETAGP